jgi:putative AdoMet-dependent methyltransferase
MLMTQTPSESNPFPASEFDQWAPQYDSDVYDEGFPFTGYQHVLAECVRLADARAGMTVLDLGVGTGNLAELFLALGCELWCTDFSSKMIDVARAKLPAAQFFLHDLCQPFPASFFHRFDRIISAYVFHHFKLPEKIGIIRRLVDDLLLPGGCLVIADISFPSLQALEIPRAAAGKDWDDEPYWITTEALPALKTIRADAAYTQVSNCAGIYTLVK